MNGQTNKRVRWLIAGAGDIVKSRAAATLTETKNSETVAIFAPSVGKAEAIAAQYGIPKVYHDYAQALSESGADAVYIATPHHVHVQMAIQALEAGKHFLCEKPLGINAEECQTLLAEVRRQPKLVTSCSNYRLFTNQFRTTQRLIASGELGDLIGGWAHDEEPYYNPSKAPLVRDKGMSPVLGFGFYLINMAQILLGTPKSVFASASSFNCAKETPYDIDDYDNIVLRYPGGRQFAIHLNFATQGPLRHSYEFALSRGRIFWPGCPPHFNVPIRVTKGWGETEVENSFTGDEAGVRPNWHTPMFQDVTDAIINGHKAFCTIESAVETARVTDAILRSMESGLPVEC
ncbi:MAG: Gfo/Idh/MocA family oxidoreductase [Kiritimatiellae bacterium]|nr:Gfo/Idh/MocA family oxidoreductase [Kiritimatiellia bacterium]